MAKNRKAAERVILDVIDSLAPGNPNVAIYQSLFDPKSPRYMKDNEFDAWMTKLRNKESYLVYQEPPGSKFPLDIDRNVKVLGPKYGIQFFQQLWVEDESGDTFLTPNVYLIMPWPIRRQAQLLVEKIAIPENDQSIDDFTGQVTGDSKGSKISGPELALLKAFNLDYSIREFVKYRGGDRKGYELMVNSIRRTGRVSQEALDPFSGQAVSTLTLHNILAGMHLDNTL